MKAVAALAILTAPVSVPALIIGAGVVAAGAGGVACVAMGKADIEEGKQDVAYGLIGSNRRSTT